MEPLDQQEDLNSSSSDPRKHKNPLNGRGSATLIASPLAFGITEILSHAHPLVGGAVGILVGALAYRHYEEVEGSVVQVAKGMLRNPSSSRQREPSQNIPARRNKQEKPVDIRDIPIPIGSQRNGDRFDSTLRKLKSMLILGMQEGGKTNSAAHLIRHFVKNGAHLAIIDKHARSEEDSLTQKISPLEKRFECPVAYNPTMALQVIGQVDSVLKERMGGAPCAYPLFIVVDEFTAIMGQLKDGGDWQAVAKALKKLIAEINQEGRKHQVFAVCIGQMSNASQTGGTEVRDLFATVIVHRMRAKQANMLGMTEINKQIEILGQGEVFIQTGNLEPFWLKMPLVTSDALKKLAKALPPLEKKPSKEEINRDFFEGISISENSSTGFSQAQNSQNLVETEMETLPGNEEMREMYDDDRDISGHMETVEDTFASIAQELIKFLKNSGKCPNAQILVREQMLRFAYGSEDRTISKIAKDWGFESGRGWQRATELLEAFKSAIEAQEDHS